MAMAAGVNFHPLLTSTRSRSRSPASPSLLLPPRNHLPIHPLRHQPNPRSSSLALASSNSHSHSHLTSTVAVASPPALPLPHPNLGLLLNASACLVAISSSCLFLSAIPTLLAFRKTLHSLENFFDLTAQELPDTMASLRLSTMEITDLTSELTDLGEEITEGVRNSTRPLRVAEEGLRQLTTLTPKVMVQGQNGPMENTKRSTTAVAKAARELREGISRSRHTFQMVNSVVSFSRWVFRSGRKKEK